jgi:ABC-type branched-subunit amino acid transport system substrate-binding protein
VAAVSRSVTRNGSLQIGIQFRQGDDTAHAAFGTGAKDVPSGANNKAWYQAAIDAVNASGGVLGHPLVPVFYPSDANSSQSVQQQEAAACAAFTQDAHVFAALIAGSHTEELVSCLSKKGVYVLAPGGASFDDQVLMQRYPDYALAGALQLNRMARVYVDGLVRQGFLTKSSTIGLLTYDSPEFVRATDQSLKPALASYGLKVTKQAAVAPLTTLGAAGGGAASMGSAVLSFRSAGVDRVLFFASSGLAFIFMTAAESQGYRPKYGVSSADPPEPLAGTAPAAQLAGTVGVGWVPAFDVPDSKPGPAAARCVAATKKVTGTAAASAYGICDQVFLFAGAARAGGVLSAAGVRAGLQSLGTVDMTFVPRATYGGGVRDGIDRARSLAYDQPCGCFRYTSPPYPV